MPNKLPKIAIVGYGAMGRVIEKLAKDKGYFITDIFDENNPIKPEEDYDFDVAIDFTYPDSVVNNIKILSEKKKAIVVGTTGWYDQKDEIQDLITKNETGLVWGSNFSVGVQMYFKIVKYASKLVNFLDSYDVMVNEMHHKRKKDSPSGTAEIMGKIITSNIDRKNGTEVNAIQGDVDNDKLHISSTRGGEITGIHTMYLDSLADTIELTHRAKNRTGFALGSLLAANWVHNKQGFFSFSEILTDIWENIPE